MVFQQTQKYISNVARISPAMKCLTFVTVPLLTKFGIDLVERESYVGGVACLYLAGSHITNFIRADGWKRTLIKEGIKEYNSAILLYKNPPNIEPSM